MTEQPHEVLERAGEWLKAAREDIADSPATVDVGSDVSGRYDVVQVGPEGVRHLVAWLRTTAIYAKAMWVLGERAAEDMHVKHALAFARIVLRETQ